MHISNQTPRFQGTVIAYVTDRDVELKSVLITDMVRYTRDIYAFPDRVEFRFNTKRSPSVSWTQALRNRMKEQFAFMRLRSWHKKYNVRYGYDSGPRPARHRNTNP